MIVPQTELDFDPNAQEAEKQIVDRKSALKAANFLLRTQIADLTSTIDRHSHPAPGAAHLNDQTLVEYQAELVALREVWGNLTAGKQPEVAQWFEIKARVLGKSSELARQEAEKHSKDLDYVALSNTLGVFDNTLKGNTDKSLLPGLEAGRKIVRDRMSQTPCGEAQEKCNRDTKQALIHSAIAANITK